MRTQWTGQFLQVEVTDRSFRPPVASEASSDDTSGRGLVLVESFSHGWGWVPRELGKTVFFVVADEAVLTGSQQRSGLVRTAQARIERAQDSAPASTPQRQPGQRRRPTAVPRRLSCLEWS